MSDKIKASNMKPKLCLFLIVLTLLGGIKSALTQPTLGIVSTNHQFLLYWRPNNGGSNGVLQSTISLTSPNWVSATDLAVAAHGSDNAVFVGNSSSARFLRLALTPPTADGMALIPAGSFTMGDTLDGESDATPMNIYVSAFYMETNLVSYSQWQTVYNYATNHGYNLGAGSVQSVDPSVQPVELVNWYDCVKWCNARSQQAGLTPVYYTDTGLTQVYTNGNVDLTANNVNWAANGYRLPTEAEWEKAARGGLITNRFPWGMTISESQANYDACTNGCGWSYDLGPYDGYNTNFDTEPQPYTSPVGYFAPNGYGLYDMAGNLEEWCWDWYGTPYGQPTTNNPTGPASNPFGNRVVRGGCWYYVADLARCARRIDYGPGADYNIGFGLRCVRVY
jgi:formylglycine-generating enzyme